MPFVSIAVVLNFEASVDAQDPIQDRIHVDQYIVPRSELTIAGADGSNPQKLVPGAQIDHNGSFSPRSGPDRDFALPGPASGPRGCR